VSIQNIAVLCCVSVLVSLRPFLDLNSGSLGFLFLNVEGKKKSAADQRMALEFAVGNECFRRCSRICSQV